MNAKEGELSGSHNSTIVQYLCNVCTIFVQYGYSICITFVQYVYNICAQMNNILVTDEGAKEGELSVTTAPTMQCLILYRLG